MDVASLISQMDIGQSIDIQRSDGKKVQVLCTRTRTRPYLVAMFVVASEKLATIAFCGPYAVSRSCPRGCHHERGRGEDGGECGVV